MRRKLFCLLLALLICIQLVPGVFASETHETLEFEPGAESGQSNFLFEDITHHWARDAIITCAQAGLVNGVDETSFAPNKPLTRAMFVTILGRLLKVDTAKWAARPGCSVFDDVKPDAYYSDYVCWALHTGITKGVTDTTFAPNQPVTRQQMATFVARVAALTNHMLSVLDGTVASDEGFADADDIAGWATNSVLMLKNVGILTGVTNKDGTISFLPNKPATRAEGCVVFERLSRSLVALDEQHWSEPKNITILNPISELEPNQTHIAKASISPIFVNNPTLVWTSASPNVISITTDGLMSWRSPGYAMITVTASNGLSATMFVKAVEPPKPTLAYNGESTAQKMTRIFGGVVNDPRTYYQTPAEAKAHMTSVQINTWIIGANGVKLPSTRWIEVHENIAPTVKQIFDEIYADPSQPPIKVAGGYRFCAISASEHTPGLAIDLNPDENYYCSPDGTALTGKYFHPGEDPYSIPIDGVIEQIFRKYGFTRGIYWRNGYKDYMHFSYFGT